MSPFLIFGALVAALIAAIVLTNIAEKKRREALGAWASVNGLQFSADKVFGLDARFPAFDCLRRGERRYAYNVVSGEWKQRAFTGFDYHYETYSHDSKGHRRTHHHYFSAVIVGSSVPLKPLTIRPEGLFDKLAAAFGFDDIDFESAEFSRKFHVWSPDRRYAYDVLHPRAIEFLLRSPVFSLQFDASHVIAWRNNKFAPPEFEQAGAVIHGLLDQLPAYLVAAMKEGTR